MIGYQVFLQTSQILSGEEGESRGIVTWKPEQAEDSFSPVTSAATWETERLQNDLIHLKPETHTSAPAPCLSSIFKGEESEMYFKNNSVIKPPKPKPLIKWLDLPDRRVRALALFCLFQYEEGKFIAISEWQFGFISSYSSTFPQAPESRHFGQASRQRAIWSLN